MRNAILIDPNYFKNIENNSNEIKKNLEKIKEILRIKEQKFLIYWIDDYQETLKKSYQVLIRNTLDPNFKILLETYYQKLTCEKIETNLNFFEIGKNLNSVQLETFLKNNSYIKLFITNLKKIDRLDIKNIKKFIDLGKINLETLNDKLKGLFKHLSNITFSDPFILSHVFKFDCKVKFMENERYHISENSIYDQNLKKFKEIARSEEHNKNDYIITLQHMLNIIFQNNTSLNNINVKILTSYNKNDRAMSVYMEDYVKHNNGDVFKIHDEIKKKLLNLLHIQDSQTNTKIVILSKLSNDKKYEFYKRTIKLKYKSGTKMTIMVENGLNFFQAKNRLKKKKIGNYSLSLLDAEEAQKYDNYKFHEEFCTENDEKQAKIIQSMTV